MKNKICNMLIFIALSIVFNTVNVFISTKICHISFTGGFSFYMGILIYFPTIAVYNKLEIKEKN